MRHVMSPLDLGVEELEELFDLAGDMEKQPARYAKALEGRILATCFFEPSTRTRLSFESAMLRLGGQVLGFSEASSSSAAKGESVADTIRVVSSYADICAMRHPLEGAPMVAAAHASVPVINAGDGGQEHPTQTLTDLLSIRSMLGRLDNLRVGFCGDLKYGRTVHSLVDALSRYGGNRFVFISPRELAMPEERLQRIKEQGLEYEAYSDLERALPELDILYMTRIQRERFSDPEEYARLKDCYVLDGAKMGLARKHMLVLHPLPRVNEIAVEVDADPRAAYFSQARWGVYVRMALLHTLLLDAKFHQRPSKAWLEGADAQEKVCANPRCITKVEQGIERLARGGARCAYCGGSLQGDC